MLRCDPLSLVTSKAESKNIVKIMDKGMCGQLLSGQLFIATHLGLLLSLEKEFFSEWRSQK